MAASGLASGAPSQSPPAGERPAQLPWLELDLPMPPSVNRFMAKLGNKTPVVQKWMFQADLQYTLKRGKLKSFPQITCEYEAQYIFARHEGDLSNRIKPLEDWLQRVRLIANDKHCEKLTAMWGDVDGVRVRLRPFLGGTQ